jgi:predicted dehydrogenase
MILNPANSGDRPMSEVRVGILGTGLIATHKHLPALSKLKTRARIAGIADLNAEAAKRVANQFGVAKVYTTLEELLEQERPDMVDICTPPRTHAALAIQALEGGAHVLIEKPMATSVEECDQIIEAAERTNRKICVAHTDLFYDSFLQLRARMRSGAIGEFRGMRILLSTPADYMTSRADHWAHRLPGGVFGESGPHPTYMALSFINPVRTVKVLGTKVLPEYPWSAFEDYRIDLVGDQGVCTVTLLYTGKHWAAEVEVWGSDGALRADLESQVLTTHRRLDLRATTVARSVLTQIAQMGHTSLSAGIRYAVGQRKSTHDRLLEAFIESIRLGVPAPVTMEEGREAVRVMDAIVKQLDQSSALSAH